MSKKAKLPTDVNSRAKAIVDFATSDEAAPAKNEGKSSGGKRGAAARVKNTTPAQRRATAQKAAAARWATPPEGDSS
jgi:hypothetical protein